MCKEYWRFFASQQMPSEQTFLQIYYRCSSIAFTNSSAACCVQFLLRQCRTVGQMIPRVFHSEIGSFESKKITSSEARSQNRMMRMECRRNASVISNYGLEIRDKKHDHHYQPTDCRMGAGFRRSDGCNRNHRLFDASLHCHCNQWRQLQAERTQAK